MNSCPLNKHLPQMYFMRAFRKADVLSPPPPPLPRHHPLSHSPDNLQVRAVLSGPRQLVHHSSIHAKATRTHVGSSVAYLLRLSSSFYSFSPSSFLFFIKRQLIQRNQESLISTRITLTATSKTPLPSTITRTPIKRLLA